MSLEHYKTTIQEIQPMLPENEVVDENYTIANLHEPIKKNSCPVMNSSLMQKDYQKHR